MNLARPVLRTMTEADLAAVAALERACFPDAWSMGLLRDMLNNEYDEAWVLECADGTIAGYMNARFFADEGELMRIVIRPDLRGLGYSRKFMEQLEKTAREKGIGALTLEVRRGNTPAISLYKSWGFKEEAVRKRYYRDPTEDAILMWNRQLLGITT